MLAYLHPVLATASLLLAFVVFRQGLKQRDVRVKKKAPSPGTLKLHVRLGPWAVGAMALSALGGLASAVVLRDWKPLGTAHGWLGLLSASSFALVWWLGRGLLAQKKHLAARHGLLAVGALFAGAIAALLGIELLP